MATATVPKPFILTTIGKKYLMAISALVWAGFVFAHMAGNLLIFVSADAYNAYGHALTSGNIIYVAETALILALVTHVALAIKLTLENRAARGSVRYHTTSKTEKKATLASRTMGLQGSLVLFFIINHLITFKYGTVYETTVNGVVVRDLHRLMVEVFAQPGYVIGYFIALVILGFHLSHGIGSTLQSLGIKNNKYAPLIHKISIVYAVVVAAGFVSQPLYVYFFSKGNV